MAVYRSAALVSDDWIPLAQAAGLDITSEAISRHASIGQSLRSRLVEHGLTVAMLAQYLADRHLAGELLSVSLLDGPSAIEGVARVDAPGGLGLSGDGVFFSTPGFGSRTVRWYTSGSLKLERVQDLAVHRSVTFGEIEAGPGDVVGVCLVSGPGVVGWMGTIAIPSS